MKKFHIHHFVIHLHGIFLKFYIATIKSRSMRSMVGVKETKKVYLGLKAGKRGNRTSVPRPSTPGRLALLAKMKILVKNGFLRASTNFVLADLSSESI